MGLRPNMSVAIASIALITSCFAALPHANAQATSNVPFVGCASDGQVGPRRAPHGKAKTLPIPYKMANQLAYYQAAEGSGVLAPRGWHCFGTYGSNGGSLFVTPQIIDSKLVFSDNWKGLSGPAVQISDELGGTSGRFGVAEIISRVFPAHKAFVSKVMAEGIETAADFPSGPYPKDKLHYRSKEIVQYETPPQMEGLGTRSRLQKNEDPILGVAVLSGPDEEINLSLLSARLPQGSEILSKVLVQQVEREARANPKY